MGAKIKIKEGYIFASAKNGLNGTNIKFPKISVGATENILIAACFARGRSRIENCACEPEIKDLSNFLIKMGCKIKWIGKRKIEVNGVNELRPVKYKIIFDRIEAGTYIIAAALTRSKVAIKNVDLKVIKTEINILNKMGIKISKRKEKIIVKTGKKIKSTNITTGPYPGFPTDLQAQMMVLMSKASGVSTITESIFENRFMHVPELNRMGAKITIDGNRAKIYGVKELKGAELMATDLRASVSLVLAALVASNKTIINRIYHLDRGYQKLEAKLSNCGSFIKRVKDG